MARTRMNFGRAFFDWRFIRSEKRRANRLAFILFWSILMYFLVKAYVVSLVIVSDASMKTALGQGGYYLVNKYIYYLARPQRGDIVVFKAGAYDTDEQVKRVVGLPGETIEIKASRVYINGRLQEEPYADGGTYPDFGPVTVEPSAYFVLGDTRWVREDSRDFGAVPLKNVVGKIKPDELFPFR
jgi:signal peptidase I